MTEATVVIAAWNAEETVARSVAAAKEQTGVTAEIIVVDDASPDGTTQAARDAGALCFRLQNNSGPSGARNRALDEATGTWAAVLDSDDTMAPDRLRKMIELGDRMQADVVLGNFQRVDEEGTQIDNAPFLSGPGFEEPQIWSLDRYLAGDTGAPGSSSFGYLKPVFRRAFLEQNGLRYDPSLRVGEDFHIVLACLAEGARVVFSPEALYLYTVRKGSISHRLNRQHTEALIAADMEFVNRYADTLSSRAKALFSRRKIALLRMMVSEEVLQALKAKRLLHAFKTLSREPMATGRVFRQLIEAIQKRALTDGLAR